MKTDPFIEQSPSARRQVEKDPQSQLRVHLGSDAGKGDYTAERVHILGEPSVDEIALKIEQLRKARSARCARIKGYRSNPKTQVSCEVVAP